VKAARRVLGPSALVAVLLLVGCSGKPPEISRVFARILYTHDTAAPAAAAPAAAPTESLAVFLVATDADGLENLSAFYVINDDAELFWKVDKTAWITTTAEGETWIGTTTLAMPDGSPFPAGSYRVVLQDVGGETVEQTVTVPERTAVPAKAIYPTSGMHDGAIGVGKITGAFEVWIYDKGGRFVSSYPEAGPTHSLPVQTVTAALPALADGFTYRIFSWDEKAGYGVVSGPFATGALSRR
jgi:hypothetical protein